MSRTLKEECVALRRNVAVCCLAMGLGAILATPAQVAAGACGDDVGGQRVACSCGDVVVSSTRLQPRDPVTRQRCNDDGLYVRPERGTESLHLDLNGLSIVGRGHGSAIRVIDGGGGGVTISGGGPRFAELVAFETGIESHRRDALSEVRDVTVKGSTGHGIDVKGRGVRMLGVTSMDNAGDGFRLSGDASQYKDIVALGNRGVGIRLSGDGALVEGLVSENGKQGIWIDGRGHTLAELVAEKNAGDGVRVDGSGHDLGGVRSRDNGGKDIGSARTAGEKAVMP